jgi:hypothetical protein
MSTPSQVEAPVKLFNDLRVSTEKEKFMRVADANERDDQHNYYYFQYDASEVQTPKIQKMGYEGAGFLSDYEIQTSEFRESLGGDDYEHEAKINAMRTANKFTQHAISARLAAMRKTEKGKATIKQKKASLAPSEVEESGVDETM